MPTKTGPGVVETPVVKAYISNNVGVRQERHL
jgi:hypothetical protein